MALNDKKLLIRLAVIVGITVIYLMAWTIIRPANVQTVEDGYGLKFRMCHESWMDYALVIGKINFPREWENLQAYQMWHLNYRILAS